MKKTITLSLLITLFFSLPSILSCFVYTYVTDKTSYYIIYFTLSALSFFTAALSFTLTFFIKKNIIKTMYLSALTIFLTLMFVFSGSIALHKLILKNLPTGANYMKFEQTNWQKDITGSNIRQYMLKDLVKNILPGMNRNEVITMLGAPSNIYNDRIEYTIGYERGYIAVDFEILQIFFDEKDIYTHYKITSG